MRVSVSPSGIFTVSKPNVSLNSHQWESCNFRKARLCEFKVDKKFKAETLVIYPVWGSDAPIFGCEYLQIGQHKFFGAIDFHPLLQTKPYLDKYINTYLGHFSDRKVDSSKAYNLDEFFSKKMWLKKDSIDLYDEFINRSSGYLWIYKDLLSDCEITQQLTSLDLQIRYDEYMRERDPARGILKAYFSEEFSENYINNFLFSTPNEIPSKFGHLHSDQTRTLAAL